MGVSQAIVFFVFIERTNATFVWYIGFDFQIDSNFDSAKKMFTSSENFLMPLTFVVIDGKGRPNSCIVFALIEGK